MTNDEDNQRVNFDLPPRPDQRTGEPFPPRAPGRTPSASEPAYDPDRDVTLAHKPEPPSGRGPVLAWHRESKRGNWRAAAVSFVFILILLAAVSLISGEGLEVLTFWPGWGIVLVAALLMAKPWQVNTIAAGSDWLQSRTTGLRKRSGPVLNLYQLIRIRTSVAAGSRYLDLTDSTGYRRGMTFVEWQTDQRIWDLVYNGILHSVADGADIRQGDADALGFGDHAVMRQREGYSD